MSGYWDALERTAQGLSGSAAPRPRALFEDELGAPFEALEEVETEALARPAAKPSAAPAAEPPARVHQAPTVKQEEAVDAAPEHVPARSDELAAVEPAGERAPRLAVADPMASVSPAIAEAAPANEPPLLRIVESRQIESRTLVERLPAEENRAPLEREERSGVAAEPAVVAEAVPGARSESLVDDSEHVAAMPAQTVVEKIERVEGLEPEGPPPLIVEIDSIEVRIEAPAIPTPRPLPASRSEAGPAPSLSDYLEARSGGSR